MTTGVIFNLQRYSIHDGPGIRTVVFLKGCSLRCWWCHNPESQLLASELIFSEQRCLGCGRCGENCLQGAISFQEGKVVINRQMCVLCERCSKSCPTNALEMIGRKMTVEQVMTEIRKDLIFYDQSGGGVTFSGGEPFFQFEYLDQLLDCCNREEIHTVVDTAGWISEERLLQIAPKIDLFLFDLKLMNSKKHEKYIGVSNELILSNLKKLTEKKYRVFVRIPIIPGINDDRENLQKTGEFLAKIKIEQVYLLPYHNIGVGKYKKRKINYQLQDVQSPSAEKMQDLADILEKAGLQITIGG